MYSTQSIVTGDPRFWAYKPPEVLSGRTGKATAEQDIWALACIFVELCTTSPPFMAPSPQEILGLALSVLGTSKFDIRFAMIGPSGLDLLKMMLRIDPGERVSAEVALQHPYFGGEPVEEA